MNRVMTCVLLAAGMAACCRLLMAAPDEKPPRPGPAREAWRKEALRRLQAFQPDPLATGVAAARTSHAGSPALSYRLLKEGFIRLGASNWVFIILHSGHANDDVGDAVVAVDQDRRVFQHAAHVCGDIVHFISTNASPPVESSAFFRDFVDDVDGRPWRPVK